MAPLCYQGLSAIPFAWPAALIEHSRLIWARNPDPEATIAHHIKLLHDYNAIRDIGTGLFGIIAERRGVRVREVFEEYGLSEGD